MPLILPARTLDSSYDISNSLRLNNGHNAGGDDAYMHRTPGSASNRRTFTLSVWIKRGAYYNDEHPIIAAADTTAIRFSSEGGSDSKINIFYYSGGWVFRVHTNAVYRDPSAWMHLVVAFDTTQGTAADRIKIYVNGTQVTSMGNADYPDEDYDTQFNNNVLHSIGRNANSDDYYEGSLSEMFWIDGSALTPSSFGETDPTSGIWKPKDCKDNLTFGTNGFYLDFADSADLGDDESGEGNDFTEVNLTATDQTTDTPTNNFATFNPLANRISYETTFTEGNTDADFDDGNFGIALTTQAATRGKWYAEFKIIATGGTVEVGVANPTQTSNTTAANYRTYMQTGQKETDGTTRSSYGNTFTTNDIISVAMDLDNGNIYFYKNGTIENSGTAAFTDLISAMPVSGWCFYAFGYNDAQVQGNFGNPPHSISSGNADANGYGNFEYAVPSGYYALCTKNLAEYG